MKGRWTDAFPLSVAAAVLLSLHPVSGTYAAELDASAPGGVDFREMPLGDVIRYFENHTGITFVVDQRVDQAIPITFRTNGMTARNALTWVLEIAGGLTYVVRNEAIFITIRDGTTDQIPASRMNVDRFDIRDLMLPIRDFVPPTGGANVNFGGGVRPTDPLTPNDIEQFIQENVYPEIWERGATIRQDDAGGTLVVTAP